jgi:peptide-methionine (S)-S-oxide reductase
MAEADPGMAAGARSSRMLLARACWVRCPDAPVLPHNESMDKAIFAAGCFWGVEHEFRQIPGVTDAACGYVGGHLDNPAYEDVCTGRTGHAEAVEVTFDPAQVSYGQLLDKFWLLHDPTTLDRQGPDIGAQYRSAIFPTTLEQNMIAEESKAEAQKSFGKPIVTAIEPASTFWRAEDHHQRYFERRGILSCG